MCSIWKKYKNNPRNLRDEMTLDEFFEFVNKNRFLTKIALTGGKPFLRNDLYDMIIFLDGKNYNTEITTNAILSNKIKSEESEILKRHLTLTKCIKIFGDEMAKLVLTNIETVRTGSSGHPPLGIAYLASYLMKYISFHDISIVDKPKDYFRAIKKLNPDIVGIGYCTTDAPTAVELAEKIKSELNIPTIAGGQHISQIPHTLPKAFDACTIGEAEQTFLELMKVFLKDNRLQPHALKNISGLAFHNNGDVVINERRPLIEPLDKIPFPARDLFDMDNYLAPRRSVDDKKLSRGTHMLTSRGCPFKCVFCSSSNFWKTIRYNSAKYVVEEMKMLVDKYRVEGILIFDDLFAGDVSRMKEIIKLMKEEGLKDKLTFRCYTRVQLVADEERCKLMKEMGITDLSLGFESGSQKILSYIKDGNVTIEQSKKAIENAKKYGFTIHGCFVLGSPMETKEDMLKTLEFIKNNPIDTIDLCLLTPFPGSKLWDYAKEKGLVSDNMNFSILNIGPINLKNIIYMNETMSKEEFEKIYNMIKQEVDNLNFTIKFKASHLLSSNLWKRILSHPLSSSKYLFHSIKRQFQ
jgi:radical SAM superfamily enzyme YgiQ (UPF0313 family)